MLEKQVPSWAHKGRIYLASIYYVSPNYCLEISSVEEKAFEEFTLNEPTEEHFDEYTTWHHAYEALKRFKEKQLVDTD